ncbi:VOC family protein [Streptomyces clavuligerus]|nr:VOC family protein [Streptomyces clavuligerus]ANW17259.1 hydroxylase [Streptomyces clavuligerus]AXU11802.1 VOC family protein [Streptomyces clavuligerus]EDY52938.1 hydroxylase [Streptomyces clavuligerus]MBY6301641.1 VOC family protein [Streptomyces clavuligerus]QCS04582.1 VOC family protein [Streptomyces clavuligerus]
MLTTRYVSGSPNWLDLGTPDIGAAREFYADLFGWTFVPAGPEAGGYGMFQLDGETTAAGMPLAPDQGHPAWSVYFQSPDIDATAEAVRQGGGAVLHGPMDIWDQGRMAYFADPSGASFGCWQPNRNKGLDRVGAEGALCWTELYTPDESAALAFYTAVLGWGTSSMPFPDGSGSYTMVHPASAGPDAMFGGLVPLAATGGTTPHWLPYFAVRDCDATVTRARSGGGSALTPAVDLQGVGRFATLTDPAGARFAVMQGEPQDG